MCVCGGGGHLGLSSLAKEVAEMARSDMITESALSGFRAGASGSGTTVGIEIFCGEGGRVRKEAESAVRNEPAESAVPARDSRAANLSPTTSSSTITTLQKRVNFGTASSQNKGSKIDRGPYLLSLCRP